MFKQIVDEENAFAFIGAAFADGEQPREPSPGGAVLRIGEDVGRAVGEDEARAYGDLEFRFVRSMLSFISFVSSGMRAHDAGDGVAVSDTETGQSQFLGALDQFFRMRAATQERKNWS